MPKERKLADLACVLTSHARVGAMSGIGRIANTRMISKPFIVSLACCALAGQTFPAPHLSQWWDGGQVIRLSDGFPQKLELIDPAGRRTRALVAPKYARNFWYSEGAAFAYSMNPHQRNEGILYHAGGLGGWQTTHRVLAFEDSAAPNQLYPLGENRYLGWNGVGFWDGQRGSFFAIFRQGTDGQIRPSHLLDLGFKTPLFIQGPDPRSKRPYRSNPHMGRLFSSLQGGGFEVFPAPDGVILANFWTGLFFFVSSKGSLRRTVNLYGLSESELGSFDTEVAVVDAQPLADGDLLFCARTEEAVRLAPKVYQTQGTLEMYQKGEGDALDRRRNESLKAWPDLRWFRLDAGKGSFQETLPPRGAPSRLKDLQTFQRFRFNLLPDGRAIVLP